MRIKNTFIAWRPGTAIGFFGGTIDDAMERACNPYEPNDEHMGWASLADAGWRIDRFSMAEDAA